MDFHRLPLVMVLIAVWAGPCTCLAFPPGYSITDLGTLGGASISGAPHEPWAINSKGEVAGFSTTGGNQTHAFLWLPEPAHGMPAGMNDLGGQAAYDLNDWGRVVGQSDGYATCWYAGHVSWQHGGGVESTARAINNVGEGEVVGTVRVVPSGYQAYMWSSGYTGSIAAGSPVDINDLGQVVGSASYMALLWQQGSVTWLGTLATGKPTHGWGINTQGQVVGFAQTASGPDHAFLWLPEPAYGLPAGMNDLGTLGPGESKCYGGINDLGQVVGWSDTGVTSEHAFLWEDGMMYDLNDFIPEDCGWTLYKAFDINNGGQIVGFGAGYGGRSMFLLTPIPEPATVGLLALGLAATLAARRKR